MSADPAGSMKLSSHTARFGCTAQASPDFDLEKALESASLLAAMSVEVDSDYDSDNEDMHASATPPPPDFAMDQGPSSAVRPSAYIHATPPPHFAMDQGPPWVVRPSAYIHDPNPDISTAIDSAAGPVRRPSRQRLSLAVRPSAYIHEPNPDISTAVDSAAGPVRRPSRQKRMERLAKEKRQTMRANRRKNRELAPIKGIRLKRMGASVESPIEAAIDGAAVFVASKPGWIGARIPVDIAKSGISLNDILKVYKLTLVRWNGITSHPIIDREGRCIGALGGQIKDPRWQSEVILPVTAQVREHGSKIAFRPKEARSKHSQSSVAVGISFGGGQKKPSSLRLATDTQKRTSQILQSKAFHRLAGHVNVLFKLFSSRSHAKYQTLLDDLIKSDPTLKRNTPNTPFAAVSINFGPRATSPPHTDELNKVDGFCAITALGTFDPKRGGHFIMWNLGLVVEFPPGSTILIPSALVKHSNVPIQPGETRHSIVHYTAGGLFRWQYNGHCTDLVFNTNATSSQKQQRKTDEKGRWKDSLNTFMTMDELNTLYSCQAHPLYKNT